MIINQNVCTSLDMYSFPGRRTAAGSLSCRSLRRQNSRFIDCGNSTLWTLMPLQHIYRAFFIRYGAALPTAGPFTRSVPAPL
jgi:hypothetical protein